MKVKILLLRVFMIVGVLLVAFSLPACRPQESENIILWTYLSTQQEMETLQNVVDTWAAETGNTVEVIQYPYFEMLGKVETTFPAGEGPDLFEYPHTNVGIWSEAGLIAPLPDNALSEEELANYQISGLNAFTTANTLYGIPQIADTVIMLYNKALVSDPPETMEELVIMAHQLTTDDIYGFLLLDDNVWFSWGFISGYGGYIFGEQEGSYNPNDIGVFSKNTADGMDYLMTLRNEEGLIPTDLDWNVITGKFTEGKVAMMFMNANQASIYEEAGIDVGIAVLPQLPNGEMPHPMINFHGWGINPYSQKQEAAAQLAVYLGANLPVSLFEASNGNIPVRSDVLTDPLIANNPDAIAAVQQVGYGQPVPNISEMSLAWTPLDNAFKLVARGEESTVQALMEASEAIRQAIENQE